MKAISPLMALALGLSLSISSRAMGENQDTVRPVYTNQSRFRIPFRYNAAEMQRIGAKEIRLYLSTDQGKSWRLSRQSDPRAGKFQFEAPKPGNYWFSVRTLDGRNQLYPPTKELEPGLKVVVDTTPPSLSIELAQAKPGKVQLKWKSSDSHLDVSTLRLEYFQAGADQWEQVSVIPQAQGQTSWSVPQGGFVAVRGQIFDLAGNVQQTQSQVRLQPAAGVPDLDDAIASPELDNSVVDQSESDLPPVAPNPFGENESTKKEVPSKSPRTAPRQENLISDSRQNSPKMLTDAPGRQTVTKRPPKITKQTRVVNSRKFQIGYKVEDVGPSGVGNVELFITENDGDTWYKYGNDPDLQSPFEVETPRDGIYGFALRVHSGAGLATDPPQPGEKPSIVVVVDNTPPDVKLLSADQGRGEEQNRVVIRWSTSDDYPAETPVALSYTNDPNGVWEPISGWISDKGEYTWNAGPNSPTRLYFRVTARDAAGNLSRSQTADPVIVDLSKPSARIVDVESIDTAPYNPRR